MVKKVVVSFPKEFEIMTEYEGLTLMVGYPKSAGGEGLLPDPLHLFISSIASCLGLNAVSFCKTRDIDYNNISLEIRIEEEEETKLIEKLIIDIKLPENFPDKYKKAIINAVKECKIKKIIEKQPQYVLKIL